MDVVVLQKILREIIDEYGIIHYYYGIKKNNLESIILENTSFLDKSSQMRERFYCVLTNKHSCITCKRKNCENKPKFKSITYGYFEFCSSKCVEQYKRETLDESGVLLTKKIGEKIRSNKKLDKY